MDTITGSGTGESAQLEGSGPEARDATARFRERRLTYAIGTSLGSKVTTAIVQLMALPVAIRALGERPFVLYAMLASAVAWLGLVNVGVGPPLAVGISEAAAARDPVAQRRLLASAIWPVLALALMTGLVLAFVLRSWSAAGLFGPEFVRDAETIERGIALLGALLLLQTVLSVVEAAQLGFQEQYRLNLLAMAGNLTSAAAIVGVALLHPTVIGMVLAVSVPPVFFRMANAVWFFVERPFLWPAPAAVSWEVSRSLLGTGVVFSLAGGLGNFLCHQLPVVLVGRSVPPADAASFAAATNGLLVATGMVSMVTVSLWPAYLTASPARSGTGFGVPTFGSSRIRMGYGLVVGADVRRLRGDDLPALVRARDRRRASARSHARRLLRSADMGERALRVPDRHEADRRAVAAVPGASHVAVVATSILLPRLGPPAAYLSLAVSVGVFTMLPFRSMVSVGLKERESDGRAVSRGAESPKG